MARGGSGEGIAEAFLAEGAKVVINGKTPEKGAEAMAEMDAGGNAHFIAGDVRDQADIERADRRRPSTSTARSTSWSTTPAAPAASRRSGR